MLLHHMIDIDYIDTNINLVGNDSVRNIMIPTNQPSAASGKGRLSALWFVSGLVALASLGPEAPSRPVLPQSSTCSTRSGLGHCFRHSSPFLLLSIPPSFISFFQHPNP